MSFLPLVGLNFHKKSKEETAMTQRNRGEATGRRGGYCPAGEVREGISQEGTGETDLKHESPMQKWVLQAERPWDYPGNVNWFMTSDMLRKGNGEGRDEAVWWSSQSRTFPRLRRHNRPRA